MSNYYALFRRSLCLELTSWAYPAINVNSCLQALTKDISTPADIAPSALETTIFYCFMGSISELTYYLLLIINLVDRRRPGLSRCERPPFSSYTDSTLDDTSISWTTLNIHDWLNDWLTDWLSDWLIDWLIDTGGPQEARLLRKKFVDDQYLVASRPVADDGNTLPVTFGVSLLQIRDVVRSQSVLLHYLHSSTIDMNENVFLTFSALLGRVACVVWSMCLCLSVCLSDILMSCAKTDEPIEMPFGMWSRVGPTNQALGGGPDPPRIPLGNSAILRCGLSSEFLTICVTNVFVKVTV